MKVLTPEGPDSQTVNLVRARRKKVRTSCSWRLLVLVDKYIETIY